MENNLYVQYGCGLSAPKEWINYDASPTLKIQKTPFIGKLLKSKLNTTFPSNVYYGDIIKGLPVKDFSCRGVYCSHTLEHLSLIDFRTALENTYKILQIDGIFRCVVPDLEWAAKKYLQELEDGKGEASINFMNNTLLGIKQRPHGIKKSLNSIFGNSHHLWMWDKRSLTQELGKAGFKQIRECQYNDSEDKMFNYVEEKGRFINAVAIECKK